MMRARVLFLALAHLFVAQVTLQEDVEVTVPRPCSYKPPDQNQVIHAASVDDDDDEVKFKKRSLGLAASRPLRIFRYFDDSVTIRLDSERKDLVMNYLIPEAVAFWGKALSVRRVTNKILLNRNCPSASVFWKEQIRHCVDSCEPVTKCGEVVVPEEHLNQCFTCSASGANCFTIHPSQPSGAGVTGHDLILYVSAVHTDRCDLGSTVAYTQHCQLERSLDRPVAAYVNLCPNSLSVKPQELSLLLSTVKHEILHSLGFSISLFAYFRDEHGRPLTTRRADNHQPEFFNPKLGAYQWNSSTIMEVHRKRWRVRDGFVQKKVTMMVTPKVKEVVREHFNCPELEGAELEDQGESGTALTHWEKRLFENEAMTGTHTQNAVFSKLTLAVMEDTGWYHVNYAVAQDLKWGRDLGCAFAMTSCADWMRSRQDRNLPPTPFCLQVKQDPLKTTCTENGESLALCNLVDHGKDLPREFQNFEEIPGVATSAVGRYGGSVFLADYCPYVQEFVWKNNGVEVRASQCRDLDNHPRPGLNNALEKYGEESRCFLHESQWAKRACGRKLTWPHWGSGCYLHNCTSRAGLYIHIAGKDYRCFKEGQTLFVRHIQDGHLHLGSVICPRCSDVCKTCPADREPPRSQKTPPYTRVPCRGSNTPRPADTLTHIILLLLTTTMMLAGPL